uniref:Uncharacterized protein n=1 Tax=Salix viminalis TaxID=40686 RepID=A0A6N2KKP9_SALVM
MNQTQYSEVAFSKAKEETKNDLYPEIIAARDYMNPILMAVAEESVNMLQFPDKDTSFKLSNVVLQLQDCSQSCSSSREIDRTLLHVMSKPTTCRFVHGRPPSRPINARLFGSGGPLSPF